MAELASARLVSRSANQARRFLSKELRAWLNRVHRADSVALSSLAPVRWCCFQSSRRARIRSPLVFHWVEPGRLGRDGLGLGDDGLTLLGGLRARGRAVLGLVGPLGPEAGLDALDGGQQGRDVADDAGRLDVLLERGQAVGDLLRGDVRVPQPGLEEVGGGRELVVLAGEVLQGLVGRGAGVGPTSRSSSSTVTKTCPSSSTRPNRADSEWLTGAGAATGRGCIREASAAGEGIVGRGVGWSSDTGQAFFSGQQPEGC